MTCLLRGECGMLWLAVAMLGMVASAHGQNPEPTVPDPSKAVSPGWPAPTDDTRVLAYVIFNQLEGRFTGPEQTFRWDAEGWIGNDKNKLWLKSEGTVTGGTMGDGDHEVLYDRPIPCLRYLDWQAGARFDLDSGPRRTWGAVGVEGLAPYAFDFGATFYFRDGGHVAGRLEGSYNLHLTQRLILQPQVELNFYNKDDRGRNLGSGLSDLDGGVRVGYQVSRKLAPYLGFTYTGQFGAPLPTSSEAHAARLVFGIWVWR